MTDLEKQLLEALKELRDAYQEFMGVPAVKANAAIAAAKAAKPAPNYPAVPEGWALVKSPITEDMHRAAVKVLVRANGVDGLPQRMLDAMVATAPPATVKDSLIVQQAPAQVEQQVREAAGNARAIEAAAAAIYFADSSDYLGALWTVLRSLSPDISALMEKDEDAAYQLAGARLAAEAKGGE